MAWKLAYCEWKLIYTNYLPYFGCVASASALALGQGWFCPQQSPSGDANDLYVLPSGSSTSKTKTWQFALSFVHMLHKNYYDNIREHIKPKTSTLGQVYCCLFYYRYNVCIFCQIFDIFSYFSNVICRNMKFEITSKSARCRNTNFIVAFNTRMLRTQVCLGQKDIFLLLISYAQFDEQYWFVLFSASGLSQFNKICITGFD